MSELRQKMIECLQLRGLSERTQEAYVRAVRQLSEHYHKSPALITEAELRQYFLHLKNVKHSNQKPAPLKGFAFMTLLFNPRYCGGAARTGAVPFAESTGGLAHPRRHGPTLSCERKKAGSHAGSLNFCSLLRRSPRACCSPAPQSLSPQPSSSFSRSFHAQDSNSN
jgi:Phage integrase, N-terminal SAM-like domain